MDTNQDCDYLSPAEAARRLGVHPRTITRWANEGLIAVRRLPSGHRRFLASEVEALAPAKAESA